MTVMRYALPALAVAQSAMAACSVQGTATIQNGGDATALATCTTFSGSIALATNIAGDISIGGIKELDGNLISQDAGGLTSLSASDLETITGTFNLDNVTNLGSLNFAKLTSVDTILWNALPNLQSLSFTTGVKTADVVDIQNTQLNALDGINLKTVGKLMVANNRFLNKIEAQLTNVTTGLTLEGNGNKLAVSFPNLASAKNLTFHNCSSISLPSLKSVDGSLGFYSNLFTSFAGPNLTTVGGALAFVTNTQLSNISLPGLTSVNGALQVANNTELGVISFPALKTVVGALDCYGNFTEVDLDSLADVRGAFNLQSSADISNTCDKFSSKHGSSNVIKGKYTCVGLQVKPGDASTTPTSTGAGASSTKKSDAVGTSGSVVMMLAGMLVVALGTY